MWFSVSWKHDVLFKLLQYQFIVEAVFRLFGLDLVSFDFFSV